MFILVKITSLNNIFRAISLHLSVSKNNLKCELKIKFTEKKLITIVNMMTCYNKTFLLMFKENCEALQGPRLPLYKCEGFKHISSYT